MMLFAFPIPSEPIVQTLLPLTLQRATLRALL